MQQLDRRLQTVFSMVRTGKIVADVGTDHGYLSAALLEQKKCPKVYACDINEGPLKSAVGTLSAFEPSSWRAILSDGLEQVPADAEDLVIAGMGGEVIAGILERGKRFFCPEKRWILQPQSKHEKLRTYLAQNGFLIEKEQAVTEREKIYTVMLCSYTGEKRSVGEAKAWFGEHLQNKTDPESAAYLEKRAALLIQMIDGSSRAQHLSEEDRKKLENAQRILKEYQTLSFSL